MAVTGGGGCEHQFTRWSAWTYTGSGKDTRSHVCRKCTKVETAARLHKHRYKTMPDQYAPVGSGATVRYCPECGHP